MSQEDHCAIANEGDIKVIGLTTKDLIAGYVELCYQGVWRAVCDYGWDLNDTKVVCRQLLNLPQSGIQVTYKKCIILILYSEFQKCFLQKKFRFKIVDTHVLAEAT